MLFVPFGPFAYWTRAEPFLIFISALALLVAIRLRPMAAGAIIGVLAGLASGFKLHGFIYVAPMAIMTLARVNILRDRVILASISVSLRYHICSAAILSERIIVSRLLAIPECSSPSSVLSPDAFRANVLFALVLIMPTVAFWFWRKPSINHYRILVNRRIVHIDCDRCCYRRYIRTLSSSAFCSSFVYMQPL